MGSRRWAALLLAALVAAAACAELAAAARTQLTTRVRADADDEGDGSDALSELVQAASQAVAQSEAAATGRASQAVLSESSEVSEESSRSEESSGEESSGAEESGAESAAASGESSVSSEASESAGKASRAERLRNTINLLATTLNRVFSQVEADEKLFALFKQRVLENEVAKSDVDISWPAIRSLIDTEIAAGRKKIENQVLNFKVDVLDAVQKGLDTLRGDLRATIITGTSANAASHALAEATRAAIEAKLDTALNADAGPRRFETRDAYVTPEAVLAVKHKLAGKVAPEAVAEVADMLAAQLRNERVQASAHKNTDWGARAMQILFSLRRALAGNPSLADVRREVYTHLHEILVLKHEHPTPTVLVAITEMKRIILEALRRLQADSGAPPLAPARQPGPPGKEERDEELRAARARREAPEPAAPSPPPSTAAGQSAPLPGEDDSVEFASPEIATQYRAPEVVERAPEPAPQLDDLYRRPMLPAKTESDVVRETHLHN